MTNVTRTTRTTRIWSLEEENRASDLEPKLGRVWAQEHTRLPSFRQTPVDHTSHLSFFTHLGFFPHTFAEGLGGAKNLLVGSFRRINFPYTNFGPQKNLVPKVS